MSGFNTISDSDDSISPLRQNVVFEQDIEVEGTFENDTTVATQLCILQKIKDQVCS